MNNVQSFVVNKLNPVGGCLMVLPHDILHKTAFAIIQVSQGLLLCFNKLDALLPEKKNRINQFEINIQFFVNL